MFLSDELLRKWEYTTIQFSRLLLIISFFFGAPAVSEPGADYDKVIAEVNGFKILSSDIEKARQQLPQKFQEYPKTVVDEFLLNNILNTRLVADAARKEGLDKNENVAQRLQRIEDQILNAIYFDRKIKQHVTNDKLKVRYRDYLQSTNATIEIRARHILVQTREQALEVIGRLKNGENFQDLAKSVSTGPSKTNGGDLGYFTRDKMVAPFSKAAFSTSVGEFTAVPVQTQFGWHIIKVENKRNL